MVDMIRIIHNKITKSYQNHTGDSVPESVNNEIAELIKHEDREDDISKKLKLCKMALEGHIQNVNRFNLIHCMIVDGLKMTLVDSQVKLTDTVYTELRETMAIKNQGLRDLSEKLKNYKNDSARIINKRTIMGLLKDYDKYIRWLYTFNVIGNVKCKYLESTCNPEKMLDVILEEMERAKYYSKLQL